MYYILLYFYTFYLIIMRLDMIYIRYIYICTRCIYKRENNYLIINYIKSLLFYGNAALAWSVLRKRLDCTCPFCNKIKYYKVEISVLFVRRYSALLVFVSDPPNNSYIICLRFAARIILVSSNIQ